LPIYTEAECITWKSTDFVVADGWRRLPIWKEMAYLIQGSAGDIFADRDSIDWWR
jgi:hypothetical protein